MAGIGECHGGHCVLLGFGAAFMGMLMRSILKNYLNVSM
jgi:hypothetical protein